MTEELILDLYAGLKGWSGPWAEAGAEVITLDIDARFSPTFAVDILTVADPRDLLGDRRPSVILASPPCETFSVASIGTHWAGGRQAYEPRTDAARRGMAIAARTVSWITQLAPRASVIENPRGVLRKLGIIPWAPTTHWYCHYGETRAKPTDLWVSGFAFPSNLCHNQRAGHGADCCCRDHEAAPRGAKTGTQGIGTYADRSEIPRGLAEAVRAAILEGRGQEPDPAYEQGELIGDRT